MAEYIKNHIYKLRQERGATQEELAAAVGVSRQTIIAIERGRYAPSILLALRFAKHFRVAVEDIFSIQHEK